jgi:hypothetical protein
MAGFEVTLYGRFWVIPEEAVKHRQKQRRSYTTENRPTDRHSPSGRCSRIRLLPTASLSAWVTPSKSLEIRQRLEERNPVREEVEMA